MSPNLEAACEMESLPSQAACWFLVQRVCPTRITGARGLHIQGSLPLPFRLALPTLPFSRDHVGLEALFLLPQELLARHPEKHATWLQVIFAPNYSEIDRDAVSFPCVLASLGDGATVVDFLLTLLTESRSLILCCPQVFPAAVAQEAKLHLVLTLSLDSPGET